MYDVYTMFCVAGRMFHRLEVRGLRLEQVDAFCRANLESLTQVLRSSDPVPEWWELLPAIESDGLDVYLHGFCIAENVTCEVRNMLDYINEGETITYVRN